MQKRSALAAVLKSKCPRCRQGDMFKHSPLNLTKFDETYKKCPHCGFRYEVEPGFFIGAMYVSYAFIVGILLMTGIILYNFFGDPETWVYIVTVPTVVLFLLPIIYRYSRTIYLHLFGGVGYQEEHARKEAPH
jgi:uncharacterized protein (DUF983 family)